MKVVSWKLEVSSWAGVGERFCEHRGAKGAEFRRGFLSLVVERLKRVAGAL